MNKVQFYLTISPRDYQTHYSGHSREVIAESVDGMLISFPAVYLRPFVTHSGIRGLFQIEYDSQFRYKSIQQLG